MLRNTFKVTLRLLKRQKGFTVINLGGLALGLAACLLISLFIRDELSFDRFHSKSERIYRMGSTVGWPYGNLILDNYPEVEKVVYIRTYPAYPIKKDNQLLYENMMYADGDFFSVFDFPLIEGDPESALRAPYSVVITEELAKKLYGSESALGKTIQLEGVSICEVTGVAGSIRQSHIQFDALVSFDTLRAADPEWYEGQMTNGWLNLNVINYVLLREEADAVRLEEKIKNLPHEHAGEFLERWGSKYQLKLEPMGRIYLYANSGNWLGPVSDIAYIYLLIAVGFFLLLIAAANFINMTTARSLSRAREVGLRKVVGSNKTMLVRQFLGESFFTCLAAVILAGVLALLALPLFNQLVARDYSSADLHSAETLMVMAALLIVMSILAGFYPAFSLSAFSPIEVLRGRFAHSGKGFRLRQGLVVFQFFISSILIIGTLVIMNQLRYMQSRNLGFNAEQVIVLDARRAPGDILTRRNAAFQDALAGHTAVKNVSSVEAVPGRMGWRGQLSFPEEWPEDKSMDLEYIPADYGFAETLGLRVLAGRSFDPAFPTDAKRGVIVNQAAVGAAGWPSADASIGKGFASPGSGKPDGVVIGVVEDYHHHGLQEKIEPIMYGYNPANNYYILRLQNSKFDAVLRHADKVWQEFFPGYPNELFFLDQDFARQYSQEKRLEKIFITFTFFTILVACLGLFGLATYAATQRTKEIGVRKVLGASVYDIVRLLSLDFMRLVLIAFLIAAPAGYFFMQEWLQNFAYRTDIGIGIFLANAGLLFTIAFSTVSFNAVKAALSDPAQSLRYE